MKRILLVAALVLGSCVPVTGLCALALLLGNKDGAVCLDPLLGDAGAQSYCYCNHCGGHAGDVGGGVAGPHYYKNSTSHGPCPGVGGPCTPIVYPNSDAGAPPSDMVTPPDTALQPAPPKEPGAMQPDMM